MKSILKSLTKASGGVPLLPCSKAMSLSRLKMMMESG